MPSQRAAAITFVVFGIIGVAVYYTHEWVWHGKY